MKLNIYKTFTYQDVDKWVSDIGLMNRFPKNWKGNVIDILNLSNYTFYSRVRIICRNELASDKLMRLFAVWCARQVAHLSDDSRVSNCLDVAERYANGLATDAELEAARNAAYAAAGAAAYAAARAAADAAADAAAGAAANAAANAAAGAAANAATYAAARAAARAAYAAAYATQEEKLREMLEKGLQTGDTVTEYKLEDFYEKLEYNTMVD